MYVDCVPVQLGEVVDVSVSQLFFFFFSPSLQSQGCHFIPPFFLLSCSSAQSCCSLCLVLFPLMVHSPDFLPENSSVFSVKG